MDVREVREPIILDGKKTAREIEAEIIAETEVIKNMDFRPPHLAAILVGDDGPSRTYVNNKFKRGKQEIQNGNGTRFSR